jgi:hypothetical protein
MNVTLNKDSWHFKYYKHCIGGNPPRTLCPYFWIMVSLILASPFFGIFAVVKFIGKQIDKITKNIKSNNGKPPKPQKTIEELVVEMEKEREKYYRNQKNWSKVGDISSLFFKWVVSPLGVLSFLYMLYDTAIEMGFIAFLIRVGLWVLALSVLVSFIHYSVKYERELGRGFNKVGRKINPFNWKFIQIIGEMIVAGYTKACPIVDWVEDEEIQNDLELNRK